MDTTPAAIIMVPIFQPLAASFGFDPIHFGMVMVLTFIFGGITPPVGATLFIASSVGNVSLAKLVKDMWPLILLFFIVMMLVAYVPVSYTHLDVYKRQAIGAFNQYLRFLEIIQFPSHSQAQRIHLRRQFTDFLTSQHNSFSS